MNRVELKTSAKKQISGNIATYFLAAIIVAILSNILPVLGSIILGPVFAFSLMYLAFDMGEGKSATIGRVFSPFNDFSRVWCCQFLMWLFTFLWSLLLIVPGIIASYRYAMAPYILYENSELTSSEAINTSKEMMKGHKGELFVLQLSFIPWFLLMAVTFGIAGIYVVPYYNQTVYNYYQKLKGQTNAHV